MANGITSQGFVAPTIGDLINALNGGWRSVFGDTVNIDPRSRDGQQIALLCNSLSEAWQLGEALALAFSNPSGILLDYVSALTGTTRLAATASKVGLVLAGTSAASITGGSVVGVGGTPAQFSIDATGTLALASGWATATAYNEGDVRYSTIGPRTSILVCIIPGTSLGSGTGPSTGGLSIGQTVTDGTVTWMYVGNGHYALTTTATCTATGPTQGYSGTVNVISTPISGWTGVANPLDAVPGTNIELDSALRIRRATEAAGQGKTSLPSIQANLLKVAGVTSVVVTENVTDGTVNGLPPHSVSCLIEGGTDADVAAAIFANTTAGADTYGSTTVGVTDSEGNGHSISFSRVSDVDIYVAITVVINPGAVPSNYLAQITDTIVAAGNALTQGQDVYARALASSIFAKNADGALLIPGMLDFNACTVGTTSTPIAESVPLTVAQQAVFDTSRVAITIVDGTF